MSPPFSGGDIKNNPPKIRHRAKTNKTKNTTQKTKKMEQHNKAHTRQLQYGEKITSVKGEKQSMSSLSAANSISLIV